MVQIGSYVLPGSFSVSEQSSNKVVSKAKLPRADGSRVMAGILDEKKFIVQGTITKGFNGSGLTLRQHVDLIKAACNVDATTFQMDSDRYWRDCHVEGFSDSAEPTWQGRIANVRFEVIAGDPFSYETANQSTTLATGAGTVTAGGNAYAQPTISITISSTGAFSGTFNNTTTGDSFTLIGTFTSGDVIVINSQLQTVTKSGVDTMSVFDGMFPRLFVGANVFTKTLTAGTISGLVCAYQNRFF